MFFSLFLLFFMTLQVSLSLEVVYEESMNELMTMCNDYQSQVNFINRSAHACEKIDPDGDFSYYITSMTTQYSEREFLFFKNDYTNVNFRLLFSPAQFEIVAVNDR